MNKLKAAYCNEVYKISKKKKIIVAAALSLGAVLLGALVVSGFNTLSGVSLAERDGFPVLMLSILSYTLIPLFTIFVCVDMFTGEFADHTVKQTLTRPISRLKLFLAKALAAGTFILANLFFVMAVSVLTAFAIGAGGMNLFRVFLAYLSEFFPLAVFALLVCVVANVTRGTPGAFLLSLVLYLVLLVLPVAFGQYRSFFFTSLFDWYTLFLGSYINFYKIFRVLLILAGCGMMFFAAGYALYERRDI